MAIVNVHEKFSRHTRREKSLQINSEYGIWKNIEHGLEKQTDLFEDSSRRVCYKKAPPTEGLQQQKRALSQLWRWKLEIRVSAGLVPSEGRKRQSVPGLSPNFWWPPVIFGPSACGCITPTSVSPYMAFFLCVQISTFYGDRSHAWLWWPHVYVMASVTLSPNQVAFWGARG